MKPLVIGRFQGLRFSRQRVGSTCRRADSAGGRAAGRLVAGADAHRGGKCLPAARPALASLPISTSVPPRARRGSSARRFQTGRSPERFERAARRAGAFIARRRQFTIRLRLPGCTPTVRKRIRSDRARMHRSLPHRPSAPVIPAPARMAARPVAESSAGLSAHACRPCSSGAIFGSPSGSPRTQGKRPVFLRTRAFALIWWRIRGSNPGPADYDSARNTVSC